MVYVDQPPMYFELFPEDLENDIYVAGESFGGQYVPYVARAILKRNENLTKVDDEYKLKGIMIGNGLVSPNEQFLSLIDYFKDHSLIDDSNPNWANINKAQSVCQEIVDGEETSLNENKAQVCTSLLGLFLNATRDESAPADQQYLNIYDYKLHDAFPTCGFSYPPLTEANKFLNRWEVQADLNVERPVNYTVCNTVVQKTFTAPNSPPDKNNFAGIISTTGSIGVVEEEKAGWVLQDRNLTFINIFNASHYVPYSQPTMAKYLLDFITSETTEDIEGFISSSDE
ncbi:hypothetical protein CANMA_003065 [Candida margitis]|uniref:uncharacterized protein n=1 Tax=Candida margitis TaxID=1775924 RepID=UPI002227A1BD|nr:uncharacterized protein CANMA_003065 [Candida margitis]KAI5967422.1 hypothetical protein CANMA_003065 [Candida margitis]